MKNNEQPEADVETHDSAEILAVADLDFAESSTIGEGTCSCVCINDEQCCGCLLQ